MVRGALISVRETSSIAPVLSRGVQLPMTGRLWTHRTL